MIAGRAYNNDDTKALIRSLVNGDELAFRKIFQLHHQRIGAFVTHIVGHHSVAEELVQDIFMKLWTHRQKLALVNDFSAYLNAIARNHLFSYLKKTGRELLLRKQWETETDFLQVHYQDTAPDDDYYKNLLDYAVQQLPVQQQKVYLLSRDKGLSHARIAEQLGISLETVKKHMVLALRNIRQQVEANKDRVLVLLFIYFLF